MPFPCRAAKGLECVFPIWFTQCGRVWFTLAIPCPCHAPIMPFFSRPQHSTTVCAVTLRRTAWSEHGTASVNQTRPHCVNQMGKTYSKPLAARHGRGMGTACYVWIGLKSCCEHFQSTIPMQWVNLELWLIRFPKSVPPAHAAFTSVRDVPDRPVRSPPLMAIRPLYNFPKHYCTLITPSPHTSTNGGEFLWGGVGWGHVKPINL